jgi:uncharacterized coiled-coil DUF342 family protein
MDEMDAPDSIENTASSIRSRIAVLEQQIRHLRQHLRDSSDLIDQLKEGCDTLEAIIVTAEQEIALLRKEIERSHKR